MSDETLDAQDLVPPKDLPPPQPGRIRLSFCCGECTDERIWVDVREREPNEDIRDWMKMVGTCVSAVHRRVSPDCQATTMKNLAIPVPKGSVIGGPRVQ